MPTLGYWEENEFKREIAISAIRYQRFLAAGLRETAQIERWYSRKLREFSCRFTGKAVQVLKTSWTETKIESPIVSKIVSRKFRLFLQELAFPVNRYAEAQKPRDMSRYALFGETAYEHCEAPLFGSDVPA